MTLDALLSRVRYLAIALPLFALFSTVHGGCSGTSNFYYGRYGAYRTAGEHDAPGGTSCVVYRTGKGGGTGYFGPCDDDDGYAHGGYGGYGP